MDLVKVLISLLKAGTFVKNARMHIQENGKDVAGIGIKERRHQKCGVKITLIEQGAMITGGDMV